MIIIITAILIVFSSAASLFYAFNGLIKPENALVYNKANFSHLGIQLLSLFLGIGGMLLLFQQTFKLGGIMLVMHSLITIICFAMIREWRAAFFEFIFLQIPVLIMFAGYPLSYIEKLKDFWQLASSGSLH